MIEDIYRLNKNGAQAATLREVCGGGTCIYYAKGGKNVIFC